MGSRSQRSQLLLLPSSDDAAAKSATTAAGKRPAARGETTLALSNTFDSLVGLPSNQLDVFTHTVADTPDPEARRQKTCADGSSSRSSEGVDPVVSMEATAGPPPAPRDAEMALLIGSLQELRAEVKESRLSTASLIKSIVVTCDQLKNTVAIQDITINRLKDDGQTLRDKMKDAEATAVANKISLTKELSLVKSKQPKAAVVCHLVPGQDYVTPNVPTNTASNPQQSLGNSSSTSPPLTQPTPLPSLSPPIPPSIHPSTPRRSNYTRQHALVHVEKNISLVIRRDPKLGHDVDDVKEIVAAGLGIRLVDVKDVNNVVTSKVLYGIRMYEQRLTAATTLVPEGAPVVSSSPLTSMDRMTAAAAAIANRKSNLQPSTTSSSVSPTTSTSHTPAASAASPVAEASPSPNLTLPTPNLPPLIIVKVWPRLSGPLRKITQQLKTLGIYLGDDLTKAERDYKKKQLPLAQKAWEDGKGETVVSWRRTELVIKPRGQNVPWTSYASLVRNEPQPPPQQFPPPPHSQPQQQTSQFTSSNRQHQHEPQQLQDPLHIDHQLNFQQQQQMHLHQFQQHQIQEQQAFHSRCNVAQLDVNMN